MDTIIWWILGAWFAVSLVVTYALCCISAQNDDAEGVR